MSKPNDKTFGLISSQQMFGGDDAIWVTEFNSSAVIEFYSKFKALEMREDIQIIPVFISSYGGEVYALIALRDLIKSSPKPVATIGIGMAMSCGASLLAAGTPGLRYASENTHIMIHQVSGIAPGKAADVIESAAVISTLNQTMLTMLSNDSNTPLSKIEREIRKRHNTDWTLSASDAKKWGFIDSIGIPRFWPAIPQPISMLIPPTLAERKSKIKKDVKPQKS